MMPRRTGAVVFLSAGRCPCICTRSRDIENSAGNGGRLEKGEERQTAKYYTILRSRIHKKK